jgi:hypothetical protein
MEAKGDPCTLLLSALRQQELGLQKHVEAQHASLRQAIEVQLLQLGGNLIAPQVGSSCNKVVEPAKPRFTPNNFGAQSNSVPLEDAGDGMEEIEDELKANLHRQGHKMINDKKTKISRGMISDHHEEQQRKKAMAARRPSKEESIKSIQEQLSVAPPSGAASSSDGSPPEPKDGQMVPSRSDVLKKSVSMNTAKELDKLTEEKKEEKKKGNG